MPHACCMQPSSAQGIPAMAQLESDQLKVCSVTLGVNERRRLTCLSGLLNDKVIAAYLRLIKRRAAPREILLLDSLFLEQFEKSGYNSVKRALSVEQLTSTNILFIPVNTDKIYWSLIVVYLAEHRVVFFDSLLWEREHYARLVISYLKQKVEEFNQHEWKIEYPKDVPMQKNGTDCGIFVCQYAKHLAFEKKLLFTQDDVPRLREQMLEELKSGELNLEFPPNTSTKEKDSVVHVTTKPSTSNKDAGDVRVQTKIKSSTIKKRSLTDKYGEISSKRAKISTPSQTLAQSFQEIPDDLQSILPSDYIYHIETFEELPKSTFLGAPAAYFKTKFYIKLDNEAAARQWLQKFEDKSHTTYRVLKGSKPAGSIIIFKTVKHCQHFRKYFPKGKVPKRGEKSLRQKKTECPSRLTFRIYSRRPSVVRKLPVSDHLCEVDLIYDHDHPVDSAHSLSFRDVSDETKSTFYEYFKNGHSAASARHEHELHLQLSSSDPSLVETLLADRAINPNVQDVSRLLAAWRTQQLGPGSGEGMFDHLEEEVKEYNKQHADDGGKAIVQRFNASYHAHEEEEATNNTSKNITASGKQPLILAICSPIMARAHKSVRQASELVFMDATSSLDRFSCPTYILSTGSAAGAIPLGIFVVSDESVSTIAAGLNLLKSIMPSGAFYGRGSEIGPECILIAAQREALRQVWPGTRQLLCLFHYLQRWWRWLWEKKQDIDLEDRKDIMQLVRKLVYASSPLELSEIYHDIINNPTSLISLYPNVEERLRDMQQKEEEWALIHRSDLTTRGKCTNNYSKASMRILKDRIFERTRAYNVVQMFHYLSTTLELYFEKRLLDIAHSRPSPHLKLPSTISEKIKEPAFLERLSNTIYRFRYTNDPSRNHVIELELGMCSCPVGISGAPCKHQAFALQELGVPSVNFVPQYSAEGRRLFAILALGEKTVPSVSFFASIHEKKQPAKQKPSVVVRDTDNKENEAPIILDPGYPPSPEPIITPQMENQESEGVCSELLEIVDDMCARLTQQNATYNSGVRTFIHRYKTLQQKTISTPCIASALHMFGSEAHKGRWGRKMIPVQVIATSRRRKGAPRGAKPIPQGRPPLLSRNVKPKGETMPMKSFKPKKPHNLALNIRKKTPNAQVH